VHDHAIALIERNRALVKVRPSIVGIGFSRSTGASGSASRTLRDFHCAGRVPTANYVSNSRAAFGGCGRSVRVGYRN
jgi:hypothetical protein